MADLYPSMTALLADPSIVEGVDYTITTVNNPFSTVAVTAVHGGNIERGTSELADLIREYGNYNYFSFDVLRATNASELHVTSTNYDEPTVLNMMTSCEKVVGCHGKSGTDLTVYVGGLDSPLRNAVWSKLEAAGFTCAVSPTGIAGLDPENITNRTKTGGGVQLEITTELRKSFFIDNDWNNRSRDNWTQTIYDFAIAVYEAIEESFPKTEMDIGTSYKMDLKADLDYGKGYKADLYEDINAVQGDLDANRNNWTEAYSRVQDWAGEEENGKVTVNGGMIQAGSVLANRLAIGNFENAYQNGGFEFGALGWKPASAWSVITTDSVNAFSGNNYAKGLWGGTTSVSFYDQNEIQVRAGEKYYWEGLFKTDLATTTKTRTMLIKMLDKDNVESFVIKEETLTTEWQKFYYTFDIPAGIVKIVLGLSVKAGQPVGFNTLVDNVFCKRMLTGELVVDGTISGAAIKAGTLSWDAGFGGTLTLGGTNNVNGELKVVDANGETAVELNTLDDNGEYASGFQKTNVKTLYASEGITSPNLVTISTGPINYWVDPINGNDDNDGNTAWTNPLQSIQEAINRLPKVLAHDVTIQVHYNNGTEINENVLIQGFAGNGVLTIDFQNGSNVVYGGFKYMYNTIKCIINRGKIISTSDANPIYSEGTANLRLDYTICDAKGLSAYPIMVSNGYADLRNAEFYNGTNACVLVGYGGRGDVVNCKGSGSPYGMRTYRSGFIAGSGTAPKGTTADKFQDEGGLIQGEWTVPVVTAPTTPPATAYKTVTVTSTGGNSWRSAFGGQWYGGDVRQALYSTQYGRYQGYWFFGNALDQFNGKTITSVKIWCRRKGAGGTAAAQKARFVLHGYGSQPSGSTQPTFYNGGINTTTAYTSYFKWGEGKTIDATAAFKGHINQAGVKGVGLWVYANSPYMLFETHMTISVTYKV
jgi:phage replication-related protein YjqB (UPF0714/DUF867 family)